MPMTELHKIYPPSDIYTSHSEIKGHLEAWTSIQMDSGLNTSQRIIRLSSEFLMRRKARNNVCTFLISVISFGKDATEETQEILQIPLTTRIGKTL